MPEWLRFALLFLVFWLAYAVWLSQARLPRV